MTARYDARRGAILLECLVAMTLVMVLGLPALALSRNAVTALAESAREERAATRADASLAAITLLKREELDQRIGWHQIGGFAARIQRPERDLYRIALADTTAPDVELLVTVVYRTAPRQAP